MHLRLNTNKSTLLNYIIKDRREISNNRHEAFIFHDIIVYQLKNDRHSAKIIGCKPQSLSPSSIAQICSKVHPQYCRC